MCDPDFWRRWCIIGGEREFEYHVLQLLWKSSDAEVESIHIRYCDAGVVVCAERSVVSRVKCSSAEHGARSPPSAAGRDM